LIRCSLCNHPKRAKIDEAIITGSSNRAVEGQWAVARSSVQRHRAHIGPHLVKAAERREVKQATSLLDHVLAIMERCERIAAEAEREKDWLPALGASRELRGCLELLAKMRAFELQAGGPASVTPPVFHIHFDEPEELDG
jgi:hypothetical protein